MTPTRARPPGPPPQALPTFSLTNTHRFEQTTAAVTNYTLNVTHPLVYLHLLECHDAAVASNGGGGGGGGAGGGGDGDGGGGDGGASVAAVAVAPTPPSPLISDPLWPWAGHDDCLWLCLLRSELLQGCQGQVLVNGQEHCAGVVRKAMRASLARDKGAEGEVLGGGEGGGQGSGGGGQVDVLFEI